MPVEYYRTTDPVENFFLRVVVREISRPKRHFSESSRPRPYFHFDQSVRWQQKLYSPGEIADYIAHKANSRGSVQQIETRSFLSRLERDGVDVKSMLSDPMVYTYIDRDQCNSDELVTTGINRSIPSSARSGAGYKRMLICLATEMDTAALLKESLGDYRRHYGEHVLCEIKVHQDGLVEVSPSLAKPLTEPPHVLPVDLGVQYAHSHAHGPQSNIQTLNLFLDDRTIKRAQVEGFAMSSCRIKTARSGAEFEYVIYNEKEMRNPASTEGQLARSKVIDSLRAHENLFNNKNWKQDLPRAADGEGLSAGGIRTYCLELCTASGFEAHELFVVYSVDAPAGMKLRSGNVTDGVINAPTSEGTAATGMLHGCSQVGRPNTRLPLRLGEDTFLAKHDLLLPGAAYFCVSCAAVVVGMEYLLWVALALGLLFVLRGYNTYAPPTLLLADEDAPAGRSFRNYRRRRREAAETGAGQLHEDRIVFNHLVTCSFDIIRPPASAKDDSPMLHIQVFAMRDGGAQCVGYGDLVLPTRAGGFCELVRTVRPLGALSQQLRGVFLGANQRFKDPLYMSTTGEPGAKETSGGAHALNRFAVLTKSSGELIVRGQVISTRVPAPELTAAGTTATGQGHAERPRQDKARETRRTVDEILAAFRASAQPTASASAEVVTRKALKKDTLQRALRPVSISGPRPDTSGSRPSVHDILQSIRESQSKALRK